SRWAPPRETLRTRAVKGGPSTVPAGWHVVSTSQEIRPQERRSSSASRGARPHPNMRPQEENARASMFRPPPCPVTALSTEVYVPSLALSNGQLFSTSSLDRILP